MILTGSTLDVSAQPKRTIPWLFDNLRELLLSILGKHSHEDVVDNLYFCLVQSCDFNKNIFGVAADLRVITVDDGR